MAEPVFTSTDDQGSLVRVLKSIANLLNPAAGAQVPVSQTTLIAGEDQTNNRMMVEQRFAALPPITTATTTVVKSGAGHLKTLRIAGGTLGNVTVYDNSAGSGTIILPAVTPVQGQVLLEDVDFGTGLTIVTAAATILVGSYR